jgi:hypothetical protein
LDLDVGFRVVAGDRLDTQAEVLLEGQGHGLLEREFPVGRDHDLGPAGRDRLSGCRRGKGKEKGECVGGETAHDVKFS